MKTSKNFQLKVGFQTFVGMALLRHLLDCMYRGEWSHTSSWLLAMSLTVQCTTTTPANASYFKACLRQHFWLGTNASSYIGLAALEHACGKPLLCQPGLFGARAILVRGNTGGRAEWGWVFQWVGWPREGVEFRCNR